MRDGNGASLAKLKVSLDTPDFAKAIRDAGIEQPEKFREQCLEFCDDLYDTVASAWTELFDTDNGWEPKFNSVSLIENYPALQSCWLSDIRSAIMNAAKSKGTDPDMRDFFYFMLGILWDGWNGYIRKRNGGPVQDLKQPWERAERLVERYVVISAEASMIGSESVMASRIFADLLHYCSHRATDKRHRPIEFDAVFKQAISMYNSDRKDGL
jgi:hypothetical protein